MAETRTHFCFRNKDDNLLETFRKLYENAENTDIIFVSSEGNLLKAHKFILSCNEFFRDLFESFQPTENEEIMKIVLPQYRFDTINILLKFYYTGEVFIPLHLLQEFIDICLEFNCDTILDVDNLIKTHKIEIEDVPFRQDQVSEWLRRQEVNPKLEVKKMELPKREITDVDDYFEVNRNVEAIYLNEDGVGEVEGQFLYTGSKKDDTEDSDEFNDMEDIKKEKTSDEEYVLDEEDDEDDELDSSKVERIAYRSADGEGTNPLYDEQLKKACDDVIDNGISFLTASRKYGITRSVIHRHVQRLRQGHNSRSSQAGPSEKKSHRDKVISWWDATNPSWNTDPEETEEKNLKKVKSTKIRYKVEGAKGKNPEFVENLKRAVDDVLQNGVSFWTAHKRYGITRSVIHRHVQRIRAQQEKGLKKKKIKKIKPEPQTQSQPTVAVQPPVNIMQLREELSKFKERLQKAINACRNEGTSVKKASKIFDVPIESIERNLKGFKRY